MPRSKGKTMKSAYLTTFFALLLTGCGSPDGMWVLQIPMVEVDPDACTTEVTHNFKDATERTDPGDTGATGLTVEETATGSDALMMVAIASEGKTATLLLGNRLYPGTKDGGSWTFEWTNQGETTSTSTFESDYSYEESTKATTVTTLSFELSGNELSGTANTKDTTQADYKESDEWPRSAEDVVGTTGRIPAGLYLEKQQGQVRNVSDVADCSGNNCELGLSYSCTGKGKLTGWRSGFDVSDVSDPALEGSQPSGHGGI